MKRVLGRHYKSADDNLWHRDPAALSAAAAGQGRLIASLHDIDLEELENRQHHPWLLRAETV